MSARNAIRSTRSAGTISCTIDSIWARAASFRFAQPAASRQRATRIRERMGLLGEREGGTGVVHGLIGPARAGLETAATAPAKRVEWPARSPPPAGRVNPGAG